MFDRGCEVISGGRAASESARGTNWAIMGDCFAVASAAGRGLPLLTGDPEILELSELPCRSKISVERQVSHREGSVSNDGPA